MNKIEEIKDLLSRLNYAEGVKSLLESNDNNCLMLKKGFRLKCLNSEIIAEFKKVTDKLIKQLKNQIEEL